MLKGTTDINNVNNVVWLQDWKDKKKKQYTEASLTSYLNVLTFHELITESNSIIKKLKKNPFDKELAFRSTFILKEFRRRLKTESPKMSASLKKLDKELEEKANKFIDTEKDPL